MIAEPWRLVEIGVLLALESEPLLSSSPVSSPMGQSSTATSTTSAAAAAARMRRRCTVVIALGPSGPRCARSGAPAASRRGRRPARAALAVGNRRQVAVGIELLERVEQRARPAARGLGAAQVAARCRQLGAGLLAEHVVGELAAPILLDPAHADRRELDERVAGALPHARLGDAEHVRELVVALALLQDELDDRPLLVGKLIESGH